MTADDVLRLLSALADARVDVCVGGGWAVDALLGEQTREHSDLDVWVASEHAHEMFVVLGSLGIDCLYPWPDDRPWNFVLHDGGRLLVDLHFIERCSDGDVHYGSALAGETFPAQALAGEGHIAGRAVRCESPEWAIRCHTGYAPRAVDRHDVALLSQRFGLPLPAEYGYA
jgi:lincosamide nucleotidyltransferase A/C/D/E